MGIACQVPLGSIVMLSDAFFVILLSVNILSVVMLNAVMLSVLAKIGKPYDVLQQNLG